MAFLVYEINMLKGAMDGCKDFLHYDMIGGRYKGVNFADDFDTLLLRQRNMMVLKVPQAANIFEQMTQFSDLCSLSCAKELQGT